MEENYSMNDYIEVQQVYDSHSITAATFDPQQELLWTGNSDGRVSSYYSQALSKYTSFKVQNNSEIRSLFAARDRDAIFCLNSDMVSAYSRCGVNIFKHRETSFQNLQCMHFTQLGRFYLGGYTENLFDFDIERLKVIRQVHIDEKDCILMKHSTRGYVCTGSTSGQINVRDQYSLKTIHELHPHNGSLSDFDVHGNYLVSCGFSSRLGSLVIDRFLMVYDLRVMKVMNPVQLMIEPCFIHYIPMCSSVVAIASQSGCFQLTDTNVSTPTAYCQVYQAQVPPIGGLCTTFLMSDTCQAVAFGHSAGSVHLFSKGENSTFNSYSVPTLFVDPTPTTIGPYIEINDDMAPLSSVPVPLSTSDTTPISTWSKDDCKYEYRPTPVIEEDLLTNARVIHGITSVPNKANLKRNQLFTDEYLKKLQQRSKETSYIVDEELLAAAAAAGDQKTENNNHEVMVTTEKVTVIDESGDAPPQNIDNNETVSTQSESTTTTTTTTEATF